MFKRLKECRQCSLMAGALGLVLIIPAGPAAAQSAIGQLEALTGQHVNRLGPMSGAPNFSSQFGTARAGATAAMMIFDLISSEMARQEAAQRAAAEAARRAAEEAERQRRARIAFASSERARWDFDGRQTVEILSQAFSDPSVVDLRPGTHFFGIQANPDITELASILSDPSVVDLRDKTELVPRIPEPNSSESILGQGITQGQLDRIPPPNKILSQSLKTRPEIRRQRIAQQWKARSGRFRKTFRRYMFDKAKSKAEGRFEHRIGLGRGGIQRQLYWKFAPRLGESIIGRLGRVPAVLGGGSEHEYSTIIEWYDPQNRVSGAAQYASRHTFRRPGILGKIYDAMVTWQKSGRFPARETAKDLASQFGE